MHCPHEAKKIIGQYLEHGQQTVNNRKSFLKFVSRFQSERNVAHWKLLSKDVTPLQLRECYHARI